jgi:hypothetical protein
VVSIQRLRVLLTRDTKLVGESLVLAGMTQESVVQLLFPEDDPPRQAVDANAMIT